MTIIQKVTCHDKRDVEDNLVKRRKKSNTTPSKEQLVLQEKIRNRVVKKMVETGGLREEIMRITDLVGIGKLRWNKGMLQAIGYREFQPFVETMLAEQLSRDDASKDCSRHDTLFNNCVEQVIRNTIRYARQQGKWITRLSKYLNVHCVVSVNEIFPSLFSGPPQPALKDGAQVPQWYTPEAARHQDDDHEPS
jgi:tRNA A37 N6-isopentenylltransferase MiaA